MTIILIIIKTIIAWILLTAAVINLLAMILGSVFYSAAKHKIEDPSINEMAMKRTNYIILSLSIFTTVVFYYALNRFLNFGIAVSAALLMFSRLPGLLIEIGTTVKPKPPVNTLAQIIFWLALPVIFLSFYFLR